MQYYAELDRVITALDCISIMTLVLQLWHVHELRFWPLCIYCELDLQFNGCCRMEIRKINLNLAFILGGALIRCGASKRDYTADKNDHHIIQTKHNWVKNVCIIPGMYCKCSLQWRHNGRDGVSNHQPHDCLLNRLFRRRSKKTSKLRVTGFCEGNSPVAGEFPAQRASNAENVSI